MPTPDPNVVAEETFCCGYKRCPTARRLRDGSLVLEDDDEARGPQRIRFTPEQASALLAMLDRTR
jgi:hypothetical protein